MIAHASSIVENFAGGVLAVVVWEGVKYVWRAVCHDSEESRVSRLLKQQSDLLGEVQKERTDCTEKREKAEARIDTLEADVIDLKGKIEKQAHDYQNEIRLANEAGRIAMVSAQGNDDGRRLAETRLGEAAAHLKSANENLSRLRVVIHGFDPQHPDAEAPTKPNQAIQL